MNRTIPALLILLLTGCATAMAAGPSANMVRVANDVKAAQTNAGALAWYVVPALSDIQRLPQAYPVDGKCNGELRAMAEKDEFDPASFVVFPFKDLDRVELKLSALAGPDGAVLPAENLDLKVVKVWHQNGNGWFCYFSDPGLKLVPELLLNDENLIKVDTVTTGNYARIDYPAGSKYYWISPPRLLDSRYDEHSYMTFQTFRPLNEPFADASTLQPVELKAGQFKQFWLTVHAPRNAAGGVYRGQVELTAAGKKIAGIPVAVRVLPFELPEPRAYSDLTRDFLVTLYSCPTIHELLRDNGGDRELAEKQMLAMMKNLRRHNLLHPMMNNYQPGEMLKRHLELMKEAGMTTRPLIGNTIVWLGHGGAALSADDLTAARNNADMWRKFYMDTVGHTDVYLQSGDEAPAAWVAKMRPAWKFFHERGLKIFTAGHAGMFIKGGYTYDMHPVAGYPEEEQQAKLWNTVGHAYVGFYAGQHNGSENPAYVRRQHGLLG